MSASDPSKLLIAARNRAGLTQRELARLARTSQSVIARIERGSVSPSWRTLQRLVKLAGFDLQLTLSPTLRGRSHMHQQLDQLRLALSVAVIRRCTPREIRAQILANLHRWERQGVWVSAYDEWRRIAQSGGDGALFAAMLGRDDDAARLRQSMPYVGLLSQAEVKRLHEEAGA